MRRENRIQLHHPATQPRSPFLTPFFLGLALTITSSWDQGLLVYANRGTEEDFLSLYTQGIALEGTIALTRYGGAGRGAKVSGSPQGGELGGGSGVRASCR